MGLGAMVIRSGRRKEHETPHFRGRTKMNINRLTPWLKGDLQEETLGSSYSERLRLSSFYNRDYKEDIFPVFSIRLIFTEF